MKTLIAALAVAAVVTAQACTSTQTPSAEEGRPSEWWARPAW